MRQVKQAEITGEDFYNKFIKTGGFVFFPEVIRHLENFIQKSDGSFRNAALIIPILYLVLQAIGKKASMTHTRQSGETERVVLKDVSTHDYSRRR